MPPHQTAAKKLHPHRVPHRNTPLNPLSRGESPRHKPLIIKKNAAPEPPRPKEGQGVCHAQAQPPTPKAITRSPRNTSSTNSSKIISSYAALLTVTHPSNPLSRGEINTLKHLIPNKKQASQTSPLERGGGCVTPEHSLLLQKHSPKDKKYLLAKQ